MSEIELNSGLMLKHGEYRIVRTLGQGGFGITYEAEQVSLGRRVTIKEFYMKDFCSREDGSSQVSSPTMGKTGLVEKFKDKFIKEARMLAAFSQRSIVRVIDVFEENSTAYYVMEYLEGGSLHSLVNRKGRLEEKEALVYIQEVAEALDYIHKRNTLHLDVKPENIMLNNEGRAVLIDFGISKRIDNEGHLTSSTPLGVSKGYAPLEQVAQDNVSTYSPATDIYSLGATLYFLLTACQPPDASTLLKGLPETELDAAGISASTKNALNCAMKIWKEERPQSIDDFLDLLKGKGMEVKTVKAAEKPSAPVIDKPTASGTGTEKPKPNCASEDTILLSGGKINGHECVDLGLSVKWATCNVGASRPEEYGKYYAWGETGPKDSYEWSNLKYCNRNPSIFSGAKFFKYVSDKKFGPVDDKTKLDPRDDAARSEWGGSWRMPTRAEQDELRKKCKWEWTTQGGHKGYKVTSKLNGRSIFLPAAGWRDGSSTVDVGSHGYYWSASLCVNTPSNAYYLYFDIDDIHWYDYERRGGQSVRAVSE